MRKCSECSNEFFARAEHQRFCSSKCRTRNHRTDGSGNASLDQIRADVAVRTRSVERAISGLVDTAINLPIESWEQVWADIAKHLRAELKRAGRGKS